MLRPTATPACHAGGTTGPSSINPATGQKAVDVEEAAYMVDTIAMLQAKTKGNLTPEEDAYVQNILTDLRMRYVNAARAAQTDGAEPDAPQT